MRTIRLPDSKSFSPLFEVGELEQHSRGFDALAPRLWRVFRLGQFGLE